MPGPWSAGPPRPFKPADTLQLEGGGLVLRASLAGDRLHLEITAPLDAFASPAALARLGLADEQALLTLEVDGDAASAVCTTGGQTYSADFLL